MRAHRKLLSILYGACVLSGILIYFSIGTTTVYGKDTDRSKSLLQVTATTVGSRTFKVKDAPVDSAWSNLGLYGGQITALAIDPSNPKIMFAASTGGDGLFMTMDGAENWLPVLTGQEGSEMEGEAAFRNTAVWAVRIAPDDPDTVWAVHDFWAEKSTTGGFVWTHINNRQMQAECTNCGGTKDDQRVCRSLAIDPANAKRVYVGTGGPFSSNIRGAIYRSDDGGDTWTKTGYDKLNEFDGTVVDIDIHPKDPGIVWAIATSEIDRSQSGSLYISMDHGEKWEKVFKDDTLFYDLANWPKEPGKVFVATANGILSNISGKYQYINGLAGVGFRSLAFDPQTPNLLYAAGTSGLGQGVYNAEKKTFVFGRFSNVGPQFNALAPHPKIKHLFGGDLKGGVFKASYESELDRFRVTAKNNGINALRVYDIDVIPAPDGKFDHIIAATESGVRIRVGEQKWQSISSSSMPDDGAFSVAFAPPNQDPAAFYAGGRGYLALTYNGGENWKFINRDMPDDMLVSDIAVAKDGALVFVTTRRAAGGAGSVYKSTDGGATFKKVLWGYNFDFNTVVIDPHEPQHILAGSGNFYGTRETGRLYQSFDSGENWKITGLTDVVINSLLIDPEDHKTIYAGCGNHFGTTTPLLKSIDGGKIWKPSYQGLPARPTHKSIWGSAADDLYVVGHTGSVVNGGIDDRKTLHFNGRDWSEMDLPVPERLNSIWGRRPNDVFAVGDKGAIVNYDGTRWSAMEPAADRTTYRNLNAVWGTTGQEVYAVGDFGTILHFNGKSWTTMPTDTKDHFYGVWGDECCNHIYAVGSSGTVLVYFNDRWTKQTTRTKAQLTGIWGRSCGKEIFVVGAPRVDRADSIRYTILKFDGKKWSFMDTPEVEPGKGKLRAIRGTPGSDVFAAGDDGVILHYTGQTWTQMTDRIQPRLDLRAPSDFYGLWGNAANLVYAVGQYGAIYYYDGDYWNKVDSGPNGSPVERLTRWNAITDLNFHFNKSTGKILYAGTERQGVYLSPDHGQSWINLSSPPYPVLALETGSLYEGGIGLNSSQIFYLSGKVADARTEADLVNARVATEDSGYDDTNSSGIYTLGLGNGEYNITVTYPGYQNKKKTVEILGQSRVVDFLLSDPILKVRIDGTPITATDGSFQGANGSVEPKSGDYLWGGTNNTEYLKVPGGYGWVSLKISPHQGFKIAGVIFNGLLRDAVAEHLLTNLPQEIVTHVFEVNFEAVTLACPADYNNDNDVDGADLAAVAGGIIGVPPSDLALKFGHIICTQP